MIQLSSAGGDDVPFREGREGGREVPAACKLQLLLAKNLHHFILTFEILKVQ